MGNIEKKDDNIDKSRFKDKLKFLRDSILGKKDSVDSLSHETIHKSELLQGSIIDTALGNLDNVVDRNMESAESIKQTEMQLDEMMDKIGKKRQNPQAMKYNVDREEHVKQGISESAQNIEYDYKNWESEQDPFARNLLRFTNWIMKSEK